MKKRLVTLIVAVSAFVTLTACGNEEAAVTETTATTAETVATEATVETTAAEEAHEDKAIVLEVVDNEGNSTVLEVETEAEVLYDAIKDIEGFSIEGTQEDWGFYVTTINGLYADYENEGAYWSLYVNDEYAMYGVSEQPVTNGDTYSFKYEVYVAE